MGYQSVVCQLSANQFVGCQLSTFVYQFVGCQLSTFIINLWVVNYLLLLSTCGLQICPYQ